MIFWTVILIQAAQYNMLWRDIIKSQYLLVPGSPPAIGNVQRTLVDQLRICNEEAVSELPTFFVHNVLY